MESMISTTSEVFDVEDHVVSGGAMGLEQKPMGRDSITKHCEEYKRLHGNSSLGVRLSVWYALACRLAS